jgi:hypothetical protein
MRYRVETTVKVSDEPSTEELVFLSSRNAMQSS